MQKNGSILLACVVALTSIFATETLASRIHKHVLRNDKGSVAKIYTVQTTRVRHRCFPGKLRAVLSHIARQVGRRPLVTSGHRSNGRRGSYHRKCLAADIRIPGVSVKRIIAAARSAPAIGGIGTYCNGIVHVDVGPRRSWHHCGGLARLTKRARLATR
ncbi:YcbK family protein [Shinella sp.]|uniref:YcbK family protein n=1 Tax=Shinella sp. TaxID=1870904 RepID=UPI003F72372B